MYKIRQYTWKGWKDSQMDGQTKADGQTVLKIEPFSNLVIHTVSTTGYV